MRSPREDAGYEFFRIPHRGLHSLEGRKIVPLYLVKALFYHR